MAEQADEWEYEYDEHVTEDFYIPIDLSNVPSAQIPTNSERRAGHPTLLKSRLRALNATRGQLPEIQADGLGTQEPATMGELQITGLHTSNPLIMYNGQLLSCHWTSTIGTDMFFTKPLADSDKHQPLRSLPSVDLLSLGTAKLVAKVGRLRPRDDLFEDDGNEQPDSIGKQATGQHPEERSAPSQNGPVNHPRSADDGLAPLNFLSRLNEAKAKRGETTRLAVTQTPEGSRLVSELITTAFQTENDGSSLQTEDVPMSRT